MLGTTIQNRYHHQCFYTSSLPWHEHDHSFNSLSAVFIWSARVHTNSLSLLTATSYIGDISKRSSKTLKHTQVILPASVLVTQHLTDQRASSPRCCCTRSCHTLSRRTESQKSSYYIHLLLWGIIDYPHRLHPCSPFLCLIAKDSWRMVE